MGGGWRRKKSGILERNERKCVYLLTKMRGNGNLRPISILTLRYPFIFKHIKEPKAVPKLFEFCFVVYKGVSNSPSWVTT
jgi:hypothetical protein